MNYLLHTTGLDRDFDAWEAAGARGWGSATMRRYLEKINCHNGDPMQRSRESDSRWSLGKNDCDVDHCSAVKKQSESKVYVYSN